MPAIELAELLTVFTEVESNMSRQAGPIGVPFLHTNVSAFEADEDFRMRVGIEGRLEADFELSRIEILALHPAPRRVGAHVSRGADLRIQLGLVPLPTHGLRQRVGGPRGVAEATARGLARSGPQCGKLVTDRRCGRWRGRATSECGENTVQPGAQLSDLRR